MSVCPVLTQVSDQLKHVYDAAVAKGQVAPVKVFRTYSEPIKGSAKRRYFVADDNDQPIRELGYVEATPTIAD